MATLKNNIAQNSVLQIAFPSKKAITPIIAIILILMMVVAIGGAMFYWLTRIQGQSQGGIESFQGRFFTTAATQANVLRVYYNGSKGTDEVISVFVQNIGNSNIPTTVNGTAPQMEWLLSDSLGRGLCSTGFNKTGGTPDCIRGCGTDISPGQIRELRVSLTNSVCTLANITNGTQVSIILDFSGKTTTSGSFVKEVT